jgi:hypothetical protein
MFMTSLGHRSDVRHRGRRRGIAVLVVAGIAVLPSLAAAQASEAKSTPGAWRYGASLYVYLPSLRGTSSAPVDSNGTPIGISADKLVDSLKFTLMGSFDAHNGRWGVFTDLLYLDLGGDKQQSRDFTIGGSDIPAGTTADLGWTFKGTIWTVAGQYRLLADPGGTLDALAGVRWFDVRTTARWNISGNLGPILPAGRTGSREAEESLFDGIVGVKGRLALGSSSPWSVPFYADVGAGESKLTWQAAGGIAYAFKWGEASALYRYLSYEMKSGRSLKDLSFSGPMIGVTWRW